MSKRYSWLKLSNFCGQIKRFNHSKVNQIKHHDEPMQKIRNIGVMAHIDAGKTTTSERMLYYSGFTHHLGDVDHGDTVMDYMEQERARGITITSAAITLHWKKHKINLIDTPGHVDFTVEVERCLRVLDGAVTVLDASAGVEAQTLTVWNQADRYNVPSLIYLNKMDKPKANVQNCLRSIQDKLKIKPLLINFPVLDNNKVSAIIDVINMQKIIYNYTESSDGRKFTTEKINSESDPKVWELASLLRNNLIGSLSDYDEKIAEEVLSDEQKISVDDINSALRKATIARQIVPVLCGSALKNAGVQPLLDAITSYLPSPLDRTYDMVDFYESDLCAYAFKIIHDKNRGPMTFLRLYSGVMDAGSTFYNVNKHSVEKPSRLIHVYSDEYHDVSTATAGNIICATGLKKTQTGDTITRNKSTADMASRALYHQRKQEGLEDINADELPTLGGIQVHSPVYMCSVESPSITVQKDLDHALECLQREDPSLMVKVDNETGQIILGGMGELHLEIIKQRLQGEYKLDVYMGPLQVAYRETLEGDVEFEETMDRTLGDKKQHVTLRLSLHFNPNTKHFKHVQLAKTHEERFETLRKEQLKAIDVGVSSALSHGPILNFPMIDVEVCLHKVDIGYGTTNAMISASASQCVFKALKQADTVLLEPMMNMEIIVDEDNMHAVISDLSHRRGQIKEIDSNEDTRIIQAVTPLAETMGYSTDIRTKTHGMANFTMEFSHYEKMTDVEQHKAVHKVTGFIPITRGYNEHD